MATSCEKKGSVNSHQRKSHTQMASLLMISAPSTSSSSSLFPSLQEKGASVVHFPLSEICPIPNLPKQIQEHPPSHAVFTSPLAVKSTLPQFSLEERNSLGQIVAQGPGTVSALVSFGIPKEKIWVNSCGPYDSSRVFDLLNERVENWKEVSLSIFQGNRGLSTLAQQSKEAGVRSCHQINCYTHTPISPDKPPPFSDYVLISSEEQFTQWVSYLLTLDEQLSSEFKKSILIVMSQRIGTLVEQKGFSFLICSSLDAEAIFPLLISPLQS